MAKTLNTADCLHDLPLNIEDMARLARVLHDPNRSMDVHRTIDGDEINVCGAHFPYRALMATLRLVVQTTDQGQDRLPVILGTNDAHAQVFLSGGRWHVNLYMANNRTPFYRTPFTEGRDRNDAIAHAQAKLHDYGFQLQDAAERVS